MSARLTCTAGFAHSWQAVYLPVRPLSGIGNLSCVAMVTIRYSMAWVSGAQQPASIHPADPPSSSLATLCRLALSLRRLPRPRRCSGCPLNRLRGSGIRTCLRSARPSTRGALAWGARGGVACLVALLQSGDCCAAPQHSNLCCRKEQSVVLWLAHQQPACCLLAPAAAPSCPARTALAASSRTLQQ